MTALTMRRRQVRDALLGRITSLFGIVARGAEALGAIAGRVLASAIGLRAPCWPERRCSPPRPWSSPGGTGAACSSLGSTQNGMADVAVAA